MSISVPGGSRPLWCRRVAAFMTLVLPAFACADHFNPIWTGNGSNSNWGTSANWQNNDEPYVDGGTNIHFAGTNSLSPYNNYGGYARFGQLYFDSGAGAFTLNGDSIELQSYGTTKIENYSTATQTINLNSNGNSLGFRVSGEINPINGNITVSNQIYFNGGGELNVYGNNGRTLQLNGALINGSVATSLNVRQNSTVRLTATSYYSGGTTIQAGKVQADNAYAALGSGTTNVTGGVLAGRVAGGQTGDTGGNVNVSGTGTITAGSGATSADTVGTLSTSSQAWTGGNVGGGKYAVKFAYFKNGSNTPSGPGIGWDKLAMNTLTVNTAGGKFNIEIGKTAGGTFTTGMAADFTIATTANKILGTSSTTDLSSLFVITTTPDLGIDASRFSIFSGSDGTGLVLHYDGGTQAAPEPATVACLGLTAGLFVTRRRRGRA